MEYTQQIKKQEVYKENNPLQSIFYNNQIEKTNKETTLHSILKNKDKVEEAYNNQVSSNIAIHGSSFKKIMKPTKYNMKSKLTFSTKYKSISHLNSLSNFEFLTINNIKQHILGEGAYSTVYLAKNTQDMKFYAIKKLNKTIIEKKGLNFNQIHKEIVIHKNLNHKNIIKLFSSIEDTETFYLILEYASKGNLFQVLRLEQGLNEDKCFHYFIQALNSVNYLHSLNLAHRDIKPENFLVSEDEILKLCDFGWCERICNSEENSNNINNDVRNLDGKERNISVGGACKRNSFCGTLEYMAPEMVKNEFYNKSVDIWSLGVLLYEMTHGYSPFSLTAKKLRKDFNGFKGNNGLINKENNVLERIVNDNCIVINDKISYELKDLIIRLLEKDPSKRINMNDIYNHSWIIKYERKINDYKLLLLNQELIKHKDRNIKANNLETSNYNRINNKTSKFEFEYRDSEIDSSVNISLNDSIYNYINPNTSNNGNNNINNIMNRNRVLLKQMNTKNNSNIVNTADNNSINNKIVNYINTLNTNVSNSSLSLEDSYFSDTEIHFDYKNKKLNMHKKVQRLTVRTIKTLKNSSSFNKKIEDSNDLSSLNNSLYSDLSLTDYDDLRLSIYEDNYTYTDYKNMFNEVSQIKNNIKPKMTVNFCLKSQKRQKIMNIFNNNRNSKNGENFRTTDGIHISNNDNDLSINKVNKYIPYTDYSNNSNNNVGIKYLKDADGHIEEKDMFDLDINNTRKNEVIDLIMNTKIDSNKEIIDIKETNLNSSSNKTSDNNIKNSLNNFDILTYNRKETEYNQKLDSISNSIRNTITSNKIRENKNKIDNKSDYSSNDSLDYNNFLSNDQDNVKYTSNNKFSISKSNNKPNNKAIEEKFDKKNCIQNLSNEAHICNSIISNNKKKKSVLSESRSSNKISNISKRNKKINKTKKESLNISKLISQVDLSIEQALGSIKINTLKENNKNFKNSNKKSINNYGNMSSKRINTEENALNYTNINANTDEKNNFRYDFYNNRNNNTRSRSFKLSEEDKSLLRNNISENQKSIILDKNMNFEIKKSYEKHQNNVINIDKGNRKSKNNDINDLSIGCNDSFEEIDNKIIIKSLDLNFIDNSNKICNSKYKYQDNTDDADNIDYIDENFEIYSRISYIQTQTTENGSLFTAASSDKYKQDLIQIENEANILSRLKVNKCKIVKKDSEEFDNALLSFQDSNYDFNDKKNGLFNKRKRIKLREKKTDKGFWDSFTGLFSSFKCGINK